MAEKKKIYLDYNSTTPTDERVVKEMLPYFTEKFGNASSVSHVYGWDAEEGVELARERISKLIGAKHNEIYFTSGATEAVNTALFGFCRANKAKGNHIITCQTEHKAVLDTCKQLEDEGFEVTYLPVDNSGGIDVEDMQRAITRKTILVCLMHANNEIGTIHPLAKISRITQKQNILLMTDATQSVGKIPFDVTKSGVDIAAFSSHKLYGPKGVGALFVKSGIAVDPILYGGGQERKLRPGTLNVPAIVGFGKACEICHQEMRGEANRLGQLIETIEDELLDIEGVSINADQSIRLPHMTSVSIDGIDGSRLIRVMKNLAISQGSACSSNTIKPSHVLKALGHSDEKALASMRIALGRMTTRMDVIEAIKNIKRGISQLKASSL